MSQKIYALLVGIDDYDDEVGKLKGTVNDVNRFHDYLKKSFGAKNLYVETRTDSEADRSEIIKTFRNHLGRAKKGDVAIFQYSGHGAQWASAEPFWEFYPDRKDEGLVCIDSRRKGGYDLADKELAVLIDEIAKNEPHLTILLDCCHSGSGTRGVDDFINLKARQTHARDDERPLETYIGGYYEKLRKKGEQLAIPARPHILLAACTRVQKAWERREHSGVFTTALMDVLEKSGSNISYADLFMRCRHAVRRYADDQNPQFEAVGNFDAYCGFLGQDLSESDSRRKYFMYFDKDRWVVDYGALHGAPTELDFAAMPATQGGGKQKAKSVEFAVYSKDQKPKKLGTASTTLIGTQRSVLKLDFQTSARESYWAEITSLSVTPIPVLLEGEEKGTQILKKALGPLIGISLIEDPEDAKAAQYTLVAAKQQFLFKNRETGVLIQGVDDYTENNAKRLDSVIKKVVHWERTIELQNHNTGLDKSAVDFQFYELSDKGDEQRYDGDEVILDYVKSDGAYKNIRFKIKARNRTNEPLYFTLAYFSRKFGIRILKNEPVQPAKGGDFVTLYGESPKHALSINDDANESLDTFKLFVSRRQVDDFLLRQKSIKFGMLPGTRDLPDDDEDEEKQGTHEDDWFTKTIRARVIRQLDKVNSKRDTNLAGGKIKIKKHDTVQADLSMATAKTGSRSAGAASDIYRALEHGGGLKLVNLAAGSRNAGEEQGILELRNIQNDKALQKNPLELEMNIPLEKDEEILPVVFDGEHFVLGGDAYKDDAGNTHISIDHIPDSTEQEKRRSVGKALKLYFFKAVLRQDDVNELQMVTFNGAVKQSKSGVDKAVAKSKNVLLLIHDLIGNTKSMAEGIQTAGIENKFDLVLSYDYENLNTSLQTTAENLKEKLESAGFGDKDKKELTILAHGMGGLVARWLIEQDGGSDFVDHLVMCGTPNEGTPLGKIDKARKLMSLLTTVAMSTFPAFAGFGGAILGVLNRSKNFTPTLEDMNAGSDFMKSLKRSSDPGVPYTLLAGDINAFEETSDALFKKLLDKAGKSAVFDMLFSKDSHDMFATIDSIQGVATSRKPAPKAQTIACHHLNYFASDAGLAALAGVKW